MTTKIYDRKDLQLLRRLLRNLTTRSHLIYDVFELTHWHIDEVLNIQTVALQAALTSALGEETAAFIMQHKTAYYYSDMSLVYFQLHNRYTVESETNEKPWVYAFPEFLEVTTTDRQGETITCKMPRQLFLKVMYYSGSVWAFKDRDYLFAGLAQ